MSAEQYEAVCKEQFSDIKHCFVEVNGKLDEVHRRLFIDNGSPSIQTRQDRTDRMLKVGLWIVCVVLAANIAQLTKTVWNHVEIKHEQSTQSR